MVLDTASRRRSIHQITSLLGGSSAAVEEVLLAFDDPPAYVRRFAKRLKVRRVTAPRHDLARIALVDALASEQRVAEIDVHTEADEVVAAILPLLPSGARELPVRGSSESLEDLDTAEVLELLGPQLATQGLLLSHIDLENDSFALVLAPAPSVRSAIELARDAGFGEIRPFTGAGLAAAAQYRQEREAQRAERLAPPESTWRGFLREDQGVAHAWAMQLGERAIDIDEGILGYTNASELTFGTPQEARTRAAEMLADREKRGYVEVPWDDFVARYKEAKARAATKEPAANSSPAKNRRK